VLPTLDAGLDTTQRNGSVCEVSPGAVVHRLLVPGVVVVGVVVDHLCVVDGVEVTR